MQEDRFTGAGLAEDEIVDIADGVQIEIDNPAVWSKTHGNRRRVSNKLEIFGNNFLIINPHIGSLFLCSFFVDEIEDMILERFDM